MSLPLYWSWNAIENLRKTVNFVQDWFLKCNAQLHNGIRATTGRFCPSSWWDSCPSRQESPLSSCLRHWARRCHRRLRMPRTLVRREFDLWYLAISQSQEKRTRPEADCSRRLRRSKEDGFQTANSEQFREALRRILIYRFIYFHFEYLAFFFIWFDLVCLDLVFTIFPRRISMYVVFQTNHKWKWKTDCRKYFRNHHYPEFYVDPLGGMILCRIDASPATIRLRLEGEQARIVSALTSVCLVRIRTDMGEIRVAVRKILLCYG